MAMQRDNLNWWITRSVRLTASNFYDVCMSGWGGGGGTNKRKAADVGAPKHQPVPVWVLKKRQTNQWQERAIAHGIRYEPAALRAVERFLDGHPVEKCGFYVSPNFTFLGGSPDGVLTSEEGDVTCCVEVKCPYTCFWNSKCPDYMVKDARTGMYHLNRSHRYYYQVQGQLYCTGAREAIFAVWTPNWTYISREERDDAFIADMLTILCRYYVNVYYPYLTGPHVSREVAGRITPDIHRQVEDLREIYPSRLVEGEEPEHKKRRKGRD